jgi:hypothetical protein
MSETTECRAASWFTPVRFGVLLALLILVAFPQVLTGLQTFVVRDFGFFAYPLAHFQQECFQRGELPFWDPFNNCGVPFLAQWNTMPLYPPALIYLLAPLQWSLGIFCLLHLWWAGLGMYFLARRWTGSPFAAAFAGVAFAFNGLTLNLLMWPSHIATFSWMPWVVLAAELAWREGMQKIILAAFAGAFQMLAGGPEIILFTWILLLALWIQQFVRGESPRGPMSWRFPLVVALVIALAAVQLLPFLDLVAHSQRESGYADLRWSLPGWGWVNFIVPLAFGRTWTEGVFFQYDQYWTSSCYPGIGTLWLALLALATVREQRVRLLGAVVVVALIFAFGENTPVYPALRKLIPQLGFVTYPIKYILLAAFLAPLLAAFALARHQARPRQILLTGTVLLALLAVILFWAWRFPFPTDDVPLAEWNGALRALFLLVTGALLLILTQAERPGLRRLTPLVLIFIAWLDVFTHGPTQNPTVLPGVYEQNLARRSLAMKPQPAPGGSRAMVSPLAEAESINFAAHEPKNNFLAKRLGYCANCNLLDAVPKVDGFFSLTPRENNDVLSLFYTTTNADFPRLLDFLGASQITAPDQIFHWQSRPTFLPLVTAGQKPVFLDDAEMLRALTRPDFDSRSIVYLPPSAKPLVTVTGPAEARVLAAKFGTQSVDIEVEVTDPALVVVAQTYYHAWRAYVDDRPSPLLRANHAFQAVQIPAGKHQIHLAYEDRAFEIGAAISVCLWVNCLICLPLMRRRPASGPSTVSGPDTIL